MDKPREKTAKLRAPKPEAKVVVKAKKIPVEAVKGQIKKTPLPIQSNKMSPRLVREKAKVLVNVKAKAPVLPVPVPPPSDKREMLYYGRHICETLARQRRSDIIRVYCTEETMPQLGSLLRWCAQNRKAYHVIPNEEMQRVTHSVHHEGLAILALSPEIGDEDDLLRSMGQNPDVPLLVLDGVQNPHNIGTIMRVMASFGWPVLLGGHDLPSLSGAAARMSEGGAEFVRVFKCKDLSSSLLQIKQLGYRLLGSSSHAAEPLYNVDIPGKIVWVLGSEVHGISPEIVALLDGECVIPSSRQVESLNVSVACGLLLGEYTRRHGLCRGQVGNQQL